MQVWKNCTADVLFYEESAAEIDDKSYIVRLSNDIIEVAYDDEEGAVCYKGKNNGDGHFELTAPERKGRASLHYFPNSHFMEGYWEEGDAPQTKGMWRIHLRN